MPKPTLGYARINMGVEPTHLEALKRLAAKNHTSYSALIRTAITNYLVTEAAKLKTSPTRLNRG